MRVLISRVEKDGKITLQEGAGIAIVTINRPDSKNAMTAKMWIELTEVAHKIQKNKRTTVVILRGAKGLFTAGSDIKEFSRMTMDEANETFRRMEEAISAFEKLPIPTIGLISGPSMGAGLELALALDIRVGVASTKMGMPIGRLGITLSKQFVKRLVNLIGPSRTKDLVYTGRLLNAEESYQWGLLNYLIEDEDPNDYIFSLAKTIQEQSSASMKAVKEGVAFATPNFDIPINSNFESSVDEKDFPEGTRAFLEKRKPVFR